MMASNTPNASKNIFQPEVTICHNQEPIPEKSVLKILKLPCEVGAWVRGKTGNWCGTVEEFSYNSDGLFLFIDCGGKYFYVRPDDVIF